MGKNERNERIPSMTNHACKNDKATQIKSNQIKSGVEERTELPRPCPHPHPHPPTYLLLVSLLPPPKSSRPPRGESQYAVRQKSPVKSSRVKPSPVKPSPEERKKKR
ncbi:hypothetical protein BofuT4_P067270.1 [Botrytis cinerea T4]|uniref:Uncharacterized protein n=1 Tax=Botryotinia fuckeliana (strain T4) TaxID=999810 RepID=G2XRF1_BOTF4|nr:hypothetical protein BofuT4_P067270.1 [Botrytis cinerea T4]